MDIYKCELCGTIVEELEFGAMHPDCCGQPMTLMKPGTTDGAKEKHIPVVEVEGGIVRVTVGQDEHPMMNNHYIEWIAIETTSGMQKKFLKPGDDPQAVFIIDLDEELISTYAYCNIHGLWKTLELCVDDR